MLTRFYDMWRTGRILVLSAAGLLAVICWIKCHSWSLEVEFNGPGSEYEASEHNYQDDRNREAADRCAEGSNDRNDVRGACEYERDHGA